jgi:hypothetical protein
VKASRSTPAPGDNTWEKQGGPHPPWKPGESGNPAGRPKGSRNKLGQAFLDAMQADFEQHGTAVIVEVREKLPHVYLKVVAFGAFLVSHRFIQRRGARRRKTGTEAGPDRKARRSQSA